MRKHGTVIRIAGLLMLCQAAVIFSAPYIFAAEAPKPLLESTEIKVSADTAIYSEYIWRGFKLDDDPVMQSGVYLSGYGFEASVWGSFDIDSKDTLDGDEVDYAIGYSYDLSKAFEIPVSFLAGYTYYDFPPTSLNSQEFYVGASIDMFLSPSIIWYHDFEDEDKGGGKGDYVVGEVSHSFPIGDYPVSLDLSGHAAYNSELFINGNGGDVGLGAGLTFQLSKNSSLSPSLNYSIPFGDLEDANDGNQDDEFYGGAVLAFSF